MNRRDALSRVSMILGGSIVGAELFLNGCTAETKQIESLDFSAETITLLDEVGETILPSTPGSPGAKAAKIGEFMKVMVTDCYEAKDQTVFLEGINTFKLGIKEKHDAEFISLDPATKKQVLEMLDQEAKEYDNKKDAESSSHYFSMIKQLTLWGYFSSEIGATKALRYIETPGKWEACIPYTKGDKSWAT